MSQETRAPLPATARAVRGAVVATVAAASARDEDGFQAAGAGLAALEPDPVRHVMGRVLLTLLETRLPDGLTGEDVRDLIERTVRATITWYSGVDAAAFILVLTDALGVQREDELIDLDHAVVVRHGALLIADLLAAPGELTVHLDLAFAQIEQEETSDQF